MQERISKHLTNYEKNFFKLLMIILRLHLWLNKDWFRDKDSKH